MGYTYNQDNQKRHNNISWVWVFWWDTSGKRERGKSIETHTIRKVF